MDVREKLVELLKKAKAKEQYDFLFGDIDTAIDMPHGAEYYADYLIAHGVTVQSDKDTNVPSKWISVKDRLPDKHGKPYVCLLTFPHGGQFPYILNWYEYGDNGYVNGRHFQDEGLDGMKATHWMPLPQPPKGE